MSEINPDTYLARYASRTRGMTASEIRALFAVAERPEIAFLAGGMPYTAALDLEAVAEVTQGVIAENGAWALQYGGGQGMPELREALVGVMAAEGIAAHPDDVVVTAGGQQGLDLVAKLFCDPGDLIVAEGPSYVGALGAFASYEADVVHVPMDDDGLDTDALEATLAQLAHDRRPVKFLYTIPNHQNPAGSSLSSRRRERVVQLAEQFDLIIVEDNPYGLLDFKGELRPALLSLAPERVIYIGTLSKILSPGLRVGWVAATESVRDKLVLLKEAADLCQSNLTQAVAQRWFATQPWQAQVETFRGVYRERCDAMLGELAASFPAECRWTQPTGGFFVWVRLPHGLDAKQLLAKALRARVAYVPGAAFYADGGGGEELRLSFCFPPPERIREGVRRLAEVVHDEIAFAHALFGDQE
ncbi:MAG: aminotransferase class I/II-fold pyridoxal phosphate-dependent enzyme [Nitriliruptorales bacterium]|nr:aminotransferase class I/II-fold pyridoxal phosphate-dependent enzyme [Nitriliruptorales bacterium]